MEKISKTFKENLLKGSSTFAIILTILSFFIPFFGWMIAILAIFLGIIGVFGKSKMIPILVILLSIISTIISPTFWLYLKGLSLHQKANIQINKQTQLQNKEIVIQDTIAPIMEKKELTKKEIEAELKEIFTPQVPINEKVLSFAIVKQEDGSYNFYPAVYKMMDKENVAKAFSKKGININEVKVKIMPINRKIILQENALESSKNPEKMKEFLNLYKNQEVKTFIDNNLVENIEYPVTFDILDTYRDVITEMNIYSGFSPQLITQNKDTISFSISQQSDGSYGYYPTIDRWNDKENMTKAFAKKGLDISKLTVGKEDIDYRIILEEDAIKSSKNPEKLKEFLNLYKEKNLKKIYISNGALAVEYPVTFDILDTYKDEITEMNVYNGFYPQLVTQ